MDRFNGARPIWIRVDAINPETGLNEEGAVFEGHQGHWADCFFSNSFRRMIEWGIKSETPFTDPGVTVIIREMTDEDFINNPEALTFCDWLMEEYGEI